MKVGDLVMLSAYGKKLKTNKSVGREELGIIVGKLNLGFIIRWSEYGKSRYGKTYDPRKSRYGKTYDPLHFRNELRFAK